MLSLQFQAPVTSSNEDTTGHPHRCPCFSSVNRPPRVGRSLSEDRSQSQAVGTDRSHSHAPGTERSHSQVPGTDRSQNFGRFSDTGPCQDPDLEDSSQSGDMFHRESKSHSSGRSQATGKPQFCVRFSDTGAEVKQANKNSHYTEMSETCSSSLTSECQLKDLYSSSSSHEDRKPVLSATDTTLNSQSYEAVLANCTPSFDSSQADSKPGSGSLKHPAGAQKSGHKVAASTRNRFLVRQRLSTVPGTRLPQGVFVEGVSAFPTNASKMLSKSSKGKVKSGRNNTEQGIFIRTKPGSYIVKKPKEDSSIHLLQVNPGNYVKLNMWFLKYIHNFICKNSFDATEVRVYVHNFICKELFWCHISIYTQFYMQGTLLMPQKCMWLSATLCCFDFTKAYMIVRSLLVCWYQRSVYDCSFPYGVLMPQMCMWCLLPCGGAVYILQLSRGGAVNILQLSIPSWWCCEYTTFNSMQRFDDAYGQLLDLHTAPTVAFQWCFY